MMGPSYVTEFYELPLDRLAEFHRAAVPHWR